MATGPDLDDEWSRYPMRIDGSLLYLPRDRFAVAMQIVPRHGRRYLELDGVHARRVLDLRAGAGEFAVHAAKRWPGCWIDAVEPDPELRALLEENAPAGTLVLGISPENLGVYDVIRVSSVTYHFLNKVSVRKGCVIVQEAAVEVKVWR